MANTNTLSFLLTARADAVLRSFQEIQAGAKSAAKGVADEFRKVSGDLDLGDALDSDSFQEIADQARVTARNIKGTFDKTGADLKAAFAQANDNGLPEGFKEAQVAATKFASKARADLSQVGAAGKDAATNLADIKGEVAKINTAHLADAARDLAEGFSAAADKAKEAIAEAGEESRRTKLDLKAVFANPGDAEKYSKVVQDLKHDFEGLRAEDAVEGIQNLDKFKVLSEQNLQRVAAVAKATGKSIGELSEPYAEFLASGKNGGDFGAIEELRVLIGAGADALREFGAETKDGKLLGDTPEQIRKAQEALTKFIDSSAKFNGVSARSQDNISKLNAEWDELKTGVGDSFNEIKELVAGPLTSLLGIVNDLPDSLVTAGAAFGLLLGGGVSAAVKLGQVITLAKLAGVNIGGLSEKLKGLKDGGLSVGIVAEKFAGLKTKVTESASTLAKFATGAGGSALALTGLAVALGAVAYGIDQRNQGIIESEKSEQALIATESRAIAQNKERARLAKTSVAEIVDAANKEASTAQTRVALTDGLIAKQIELNNARRDGDKDAEAAAKRDVEALRAARNAADDMAAREEIAQQRIDKARAKAYEFTDRAAEEFEAKRKARAEEAAQDAEKAAEKAAAAAERARALNAEELELKRSALALDAQKTELADAEIVALEAKLDAGQNVTAELERELKGRAENQKRLIEAEASLDRIQIKQEAIAKAAADPGNAERIQQLAAERERQLNQKVAQDKARVDRQLANDQADLAKKAAAAAKKRDEEQKEAAAKKLELEAKHADLALQSYENQRQSQQTLFGERRRQYEEDIALGYNRSVELQKLDEEQAKAEKANILELEKLTVEGIKRRAAAEQAGKSKEEQALVEKKAQLEIEKAHQQAKTEANAIVDKSLSLLKDQTAEELKQLEVLREKNAELKKAQGFDLGSTFATGAQSVEDAFTGNASSLGVSRRDREAGEAVTDDGRTQAELERDIKRRRGIITNRENAAKKAGQATTPTPNGNSSQAPSPSGNSAQGTQGEAGSQSSSSKPSTPAPAEGGSASSAPPASPLATGGDTAAIVAQLVQLNQGVAQLIQSNSALLQSAQAQSKRQPSTLGNEFARGRNRPDGTY